MRLYTRKYVNKYYQKNKIRCIKATLSYITKRRKIDLNFNIQCRLRALFAQAIKKYSVTGKITTSKKYGINYENIIEHLKPFPKNIMLYEIDHIRPLSSFNLTRRNEIKIAFAPENHQWLTIKQNREKGAKY